MLNPEQLDQLSRRIANALPGAGGLGKDFKSTLRALLESNLAQLDLVSRQEFDVQSAVLQRTRAKLEQLNARVATLEAQLAETPQPAPQQQQPD